MNNNALVAIGSGSAKPVTTFTADTKAPTLTRFEVSMDGAGEFVFVFDETIQASKIDPTKITILGDGKSIKLTGGTFSTAAADDSAIIKIVPTSLDIDFIKNYFDQAIFETNAAVSFESLAFVDMNNVAILPSQRAVDSYKRDITPPTVLSFTVSLDHQSGFIEIDFNEPIMLQQVDLDGLFLSNGAEKVQISSIDCSVLDASGVKAKKTLSVSIGRATMLNIQGNAAVCANPLTCKLSYEPEFIKDTALNAIVRFENFNNILGFTIDAVVPYVESWGANMDLRSFTFTFNEYIAPASYSVTFADVKINAQQEREITSSHTVLLSHNGGGTLTSSLSTADVNELKRLRVCVTDTSCYVLFADLTDHTGLVGDNTRPFEVSPSAYVKDSTAPQLVEVSEIDFDSLTIKIKFDETIDMALVDLTKITIQEFERDPRAAHTLTSPKTQVSSLDGTVLTFTLSEFDANTIKFSDLMGVVLSNTYVFIDSGAVLDVFGNSYAAGSKAVVPQTLKRDASAPTIVAFGMDVDAGQLKVSFDEPINTIKFTANKVVIQDENANSELRLSGGNIVQEIGLTTVLVQMTPADIVLMKSRPVATTKASSFIRMDLGAVIDKSPNENAIAPIAVDKAIPATEFVADTTAPILTGFEFDGTSTAVKLTFNEPMSIAAGVSLRFANILLVDGPSSLELPLDATLDNGVSDGDTVISFTLTDAKRLELRLLTIATQATNTFIAFKPFAISDVAGNFIAEIPTSSPFAATEFSPDIVAPSLTSYVLDLDADVLRLTFNDVVLASSFEASGISIRDSNLISPLKFERLDSAQTSQSPSIVTSQSGYVIDIKLGFSDLLALERDVDFATARENTFLVLESKTFRGTNNMQVVAVIEGSAKQPSTVVPDTTAPTLVSFDYNAANGNVVVVFSEAMDRASLDTTELSLTSSDTTTLLSLAGSIGAENTGSDVNTLNSYKYSFTIAPTAYQAVQKDLAICDRPDNLCAIVATEDAMKDSAGNKLAVITKAAAKSVTTFTVDNVQPFVSSFSLDMNAGVLTIIFSEVVKGDTIKPQDITVQETAQASSGTATPVQLSGGQVTLVDSITQVITLTVGDLDKIKAQITLARSDVTSRITFSDNLISDMVVRESNPPYALISDTTLRPNKVVAIVDGQAKAAATYKTDTTVPTLVSFALDLTQETLTMVFSETVNRDSLKVDKLRLQNGAGDFVDLTAGVVSQPALNTLVVKMDIVDLNMIKDKKGASSLATGEADTFLFIASGAVKDMFDNANVDTTQKIATGGYTPDNTAPELASFSLDMDGRVLTCVFTETVHAVDVDASGVTLQYKVVSDDAEKTHSLAAVSGITQVNLFTVSIALEKVDFDEIARTPELGTSIDFTFASVASTFAKDTAGNTVKVIAPGAGKKAATYKEDKQSPSLLQFNLNMDGTHGSITMLFTETVLVSSIEVGDIVLQSKQSDGAATQSRPLSSGALPAKSSLAVNSVDSTTVVVTLGLDDMNFIKSQQELAVSLQSSWISIKTTTITDMNNNAVVAIDKSNAQVAKDFTADGTKPELSSFSIDFNSHQTKAIIEFTFTETMKADTFQTGDFAIMDGSAFTATSFALQADSKTQTDSTKLSVTLTTEQTNLIKKTLTMAVDADSTYISIAAGA
eukprot:UC1_evm1s1546